MITTNILPSENGPCPLFFKCAQFRIRYQEQINELQGAIKYDVINNLKERAQVSYVKSIYASNLDINTMITKLSDTKGTEDAVQTIVDFMLDPKNSNVNRTNRDGLSAIESKALDGVQKYYDQELSGPENSMAADIYGGVTNNFIGGGHPVDYFYNNKNELSYSLTSEFYAEALSTFAVGPVAFQESARKFLPTSTDRFDDIMWTIVQ